MKTFLQMDKLKLTRLISRSVFALGFCLAVMPQTPAQMPSILDEQTLSLIQDVIQAPELMNIDYLQYRLGLPDRGRPVLANGLRNYQWYSKDLHLMRYKLEEPMAWPGQVSHASLTINLPRSLVTKAQVYKEFGKPTRFYFNRKGEPTEDYVFPSGVTASFIEPHNSFRVSHVILDYSGAPLPLPTQNQIGMAIMQRRAIAMEHHQNGNYKESMPLLEHHLSHSPFDYQAHLALAQAYSKSAHLNEAITEYSRTLQTCGNDYAVRDQCIKELNDMHVNVESSSQVASSGYPFF